MTDFGTQVVSKKALFRLKKKGFAVPVVGIDHIIVTPRLFPLPLLEEIFLGVFVLGEEVIPLLNLHRYLDAENNRLSDKGSFAILFMTDFGKIALPADEVLRIVEDTEGTVEKKSDTHVVIADRCFLFDDARYPLLSERNLIEILTG